MAATVLGRIDRYTITREPEGIVIVMSQREQTQRVRAMFLVAAAVVPLLWLWMIGNRPVAWIIAGLSAFMLLYGVRVAQAFASYRERWVVTGRAIRVRRTDETASAEWLLGAVGVRAGRVLPTGGEETVTLRDGRLRLRWRVDRRSDSEAIELIHLDVLDAAGAPTGHEFQFMWPRSAEAFVATLARAVPVDVERATSV
jgi:uncharacterized membrane protein